MVGNEHKSEVDPTENHTSLLLLPRIENKRIVLLCGKLENTRNHKRSCNLRSSKGRPQETMQVFSLIHSW